MTEQYCSVNRKLETGFLQETRFLALQLSLTDKYWMTEIFLSTILIVTDDVFQTSEIDGARTESVAKESWADDFGRVETAVLLK